MPILKTMAKHVFVMGELGAGHAISVSENPGNMAIPLNKCGKAVIISSELNVPLYAGPPAATL